MQICRQILQTAQTKDRHVRRLGDAEFVRGTASDIALRIHEITEALRAQCPQMLEVLQFDQARIRRALACQFGESGLERDDFRPLRRQHLDTSGLEDLTRVLELVEVLSKAAVQDAFEPGSHVSSVSARRKGAILNPEGKLKKTAPLKYLFVLVSIIVVWIAQLAIASFLHSGERFELYVITIVFTFMLYLLGFWKQA